jgi:TatD DNase family protein
MTAVIDTHAHIQLAAFDGDREAVLQRAWEAGLEAIIVPGVDVASTEKSITIAERDSRVYAAAGCHPHDAAGAGAKELARLAELARRPRVVAVGEIGLDFYRNLSRRDVQLDVFRRQLSTAADLNLPVILHCRDAHNEILPVLEDWSHRLGGALADGRPLGVMHYFSGNLALAERYLDLGFLISIHDSVTYPRSQKLRSVATAVPLDHLVLETDSPYGAPRSHQGQRNEPSYIGEAVAAVAELRGVAFQEVASRATENAVRLFDLVRTQEQVTSGAGHPAAERGAP